MRLERHALYTGNLILDATIVNQFTIKFSNTILISGKYQLRAVGCMREREDDNLCQVQENFNFRNNEHLFLVDGI